MHFFFLVSPWLVVNEQPHVRRVSTVLSLRPDLNQHHHGINEHRVSVFVDTMPFDSQKLVPLGVGIVADGAKEVKTLLSAAHPPHSLLG